MTLTASEQWCWYLDHKRHLRIELDDNWCFVTPYASEILIPLILKKKRLRMSIDEARYYQHLCSQLQSALRQWSPAQLTQAALNGTAAQYLLQMPANRSWQFEKTTARRDYWQVGDISTVFIGDKPARAVILAHDARAATCMLLEPLSLGRPEKYLLEFTTLRLNLSCLFDAQVGGDRQPFRRSAEFTLRADSSSSRNDLLLSETMLYRMAV